MKGAESERASGENTLQPFAWGSTHPTQEDETLEHGPMGHKTVVHTMDVVDVVCEGRGFQAREP